MFKNIESIVNRRSFSLAMFACVLGFVLFKRFYRDLGDVFLFFLVLGTLLSAYYSARPTRKDPVVIAFFISLIIPVLSWANSRLQIPELAKASPSPFFFYDFFFFWFIAYWTQGKNERIAAILLAFCLGVLGIYISHSADFLGELVLGLKGARIDFGVVNAQYTSLFAGFGLIAAVFLFLAKVNLNHKLLLLKKIIATALIIFFIIIIVITQSRQVWLALVACLFLTPLLYTVISRSATSKRAIFASYLALALAMAAAANLDIVKDRVAAEEYTLAKVVNLEFDAVPNTTSIGLRVHLWLEGWEWIQQRPVLGSGEDARELVISQSDSLPESVRASFTHLHNSHIETVLSFGAVGAVLVYFLMIWPPLATAASSATPVKKTWRVFSLIALVFWLTVNCFESYFYSANGLYIFTVFFGIIYSFRFVSSEDRPDPDQPPP